MKALWKVMLCPPGEVLPVTIRADICEMSDDEGLYFYNYPSHAANPRSLMMIFAPGQWVMAERIYEVEGSENTIHYVAKKGQE